MAFLTDNDFDLQTLCTGVNAVPISAGPVTESKLFVEMPVPTTEVAIELLDNQLTLVQSSLRGAPGDMHPLMRRSMAKFTAPHLRTESMILADSWQNRTGFLQKGAPASALVERDRILAEHSRRINATIDFHKTRALAGQVLDADGSVLIDLLAEFGVVQHEVDCGLDTAETQVANKLIAGRRLSDAELGMSAAKRFVAFADATFMDALRAHPSVEAAVSGWSAATIMLDDHRAGDLVVGGIRFVEVTNRAGKVFIAPGTALLCPEGVPDLFVTYFAPADYIDAVNQDGMPLYSRADELPFNRGVHIETQSNPVSVLTRPKAVVKLMA